MQTVSTVAMSATMAAVAAPQPPEVAAYVMMFAMAPMMAKMVQL